MSNDGVKEILFRQRKTEEGEDKGEVGSDME